MIGDVLPEMKNGKSPVGDLIRHIVNLAVCSIRTPARSSQSGFLYKYGTGPILIKFSVRMGTVASNVAGNI